MKQFVIIFYKNGHEVERKTFASNDDDPDIMTHLLSTWYNYDDYELYRMTFMSHGPAPEILMKGSE